MRPGGPPRVEPAPEPEVEREPPPDPDGEPMVALARAAVHLASELVPVIAPGDIDIAADLVASLAVLECCAIEATACRGRVRRKLCEIARGKAARSQALLRGAAAFGLIAAAQVAPVHDALEEALIALAPSVRMQLAELLRR